MANAMFPATPPRWITRSSTKKLSDTFCRCSASRCSENRPGNRIRLSVAIEPVTAIVTKFHPFSSKVRLAKRTGGSGWLRVVGGRPLASVAEPSGGLTRPRSCDLATRGDAHMPGPFSSDHRLGADGLPFSDTHPSEPIPTPPAYPPPVVAYPGPLPPPMPFPTPPRRRRLFIGAAVALLVVAGVAAAIVYGSHGTTKPAPGAFSDATATAAIQNYLTALEHRDTET